MTFVIHYLSGLSLTFFRLSVVLKNKNNFFYYDKISGEEIERSKLRKDIDGPHRNAITCYIQNKKQYLKYLLIFMTIFTS